MNHGAMGGRCFLNLLPYSTTPCKDGVGIGTPGSSSWRHSVHHHHRTSKVVAGRRSAAASVSCSAASAQAPPSQSTIKVVIVGATKEMGRAAIAAVSRARGMELAGAIDTQCIGMDAGELSGMDEALEIPVLNDLTMVLGSIAQVSISIFTCGMLTHHVLPFRVRVSLTAGRFCSFQTRATGVVVDFSEPSSVYDNVKQAAAFGLSSVVYVPKIEMDTVTELSAFCDKASMGCLVAPTLSIGSVLLQQAAIQASFHYNNVEIVESRPNPSDLPSPDAIQIANNISDLGQIYNRQDMDSDNPARGQVLGEDGVRVHSMVLPGLASSTSVVLSGPGEVYTLKHDVTDVQSLMPGLILAIRKVIRLKNLIYGLEKFL
ncbi:dihydrodipicolinate reductase-like protein CRR1, chloroplastic isoform X1 [Triticum urartu]|uniref:dihydrodipicolinate reductase-like protein CRR1, chloroplastic isoform X1 n=1 Tax=Triticum dicoccoides TaxID=85692 RepID=UPI00188E5394|nr:dihydrodipicolinate reductase-like protein CRR1, chloroplastic isoform X1 [Triticum dicoccoides]XP_044384136.1 dihydrodipicolinate reductase-like protein CRR1, chloroplastic isoform X1 [Triticum aestivum]XP_048532907.1 dihydrodipicolinate reductase-like protein CRR1, chloroplastic isoform X1 [Triticum urartu]